GAQGFGEESVLDGGQKGKVPATGSVRPGLHKPRLGDHKVAWWDPGVLELDVEENVGVRQQRILEADESGEEVARGEEAYRRWKESLSTAIAHGSCPSIQVQTATAFAAGAASGELDLANIQIETVQRIGAERPGDRRFGALVHAVLATVDLNSSSDQIKAVAEANGRLVNATREEIDAAVTTVNEALKHPLMRRAAIALCMRR